MSERSLGAAAAVVLCCAVPLSACHAYDSALLRFAGSTFHPDAGASDAGRDASGGDGGGHGDAASEACVAAPEGCNRLDDDCDGKVDEDAVSACAQIILNGESDCVPTGTSASCVLLRCNDGFDNCDGNPANGCEPYCACHDCSDSGTEEDAH